MPVLLDFAGDFDVDTAFSDLRRFAEGGVITVCTINVARGP